MASFVESATLAINDDSTKKIDKINNSLKKLYATAKRTANALKGIDFEPKGLANASRRIGAVTASLNKLGRTRVRPQLDMSGVNSQLGKLTSRNIRINVSANIQGLQSQLNSKSLRVNLASSFEPLKGIGREIAHEIRSAIVQGVARGIKDGYSGIDVAETRIQRQGLTPGAQSTLRQAVLAQENVSGNVFDRGQLMGLASEASPMLNDSLTGMDVIISKMGQMGTILVGFGKTVQDADDGLNKYNKVAEQSGRMYDRTTGQFDPKAYSNFMDIISRAMIQFGKEIDANVVEQTFRALQGSKMSLNDAGIISLLGYMEEQRSSAGVATNQLIKQLSGDRIQKKQLKNMINMGLVETENVEVSKTNKKGVVSTTTEQAVKGVVDEELLRSNPLEWTNKHLISKMHEQGLDPMNNTHINKFANMISSDRTATSGLVTMLTRYQDFMRQAEKLQGLSMTSETQQEMVNQSGLITLGEAQSKVTTLLGLMSSALETAAIPALQTFSGWMQKLNEFVAPEGKTNTTNAGIVAGVGVLGGIGALVGGKAVASALFNPFATANASLTTAGTNLNAAALALQRAAGVPGTPGAVPVGTAPQSRSMGMLNGVLVATGVYAADQAVQQGLNQIDERIVPTLTKIGDFLFPFRRIGEDINNVQKAAAWFSEVPRTPVGVTSQIALQSATHPGKTKDDLGIGLVEGMRTESQNLQDALTNGSTVGAASLGQGIVQGAQTAAGIIANAISSAAANIRITAQTSSANQIAPVDTGANPLTRHH